MKLTKKKIAICFFCSRIKHMKHLSILSILAACSLFAVCADAADKKPAPQKPKPRRIVNRVAAVVNGRPITSAEVRSRLMPYVKELTMLYPQQGRRFNGELIKAKKAVLDELIERELVLSDFEGKGLTMPETAVEEEINRRILTQFNGNRDALLNNLRASGMTYSEFRDSVRKELTVHSMRSMRYDRDIPPTPDEIQAEYRATRSDYRDMTRDEIRYEKIYLPYGMGPDPNATPEEHRAFAYSLVEAIKKGEITFEEAARQYSQDEYAAEGGKWPFRKRSEHSVEFANLVFSLPKGELTGPLEAPQGCFTIVRVLEMKKAPAPSLNARGIKARVDESVRRKKSEQRYREWIGRLRSKAVIRIYI